MSKVHRRPLSLLIVLTLLAVACAGSLTRRHRFASEKTGGTDDVAVSVFVLDAPAEAAPPTLLTLAERGQSALVQTLSSKTTSAEELFASLGGRIGKTPGQGVVVRDVRFKKRLVLSAERASAAHGNAADRVQYLAYKVALPPSDGSGGVTFASWSKFTTEYGTVDLGKITLGQSIEASLSAGPAVGAAVPVSGSVTAARNLTEELSLRQRYVSLTGILTEKQARLIQEGVVGIDLSGNAAVDVEIEVTACSQPEPIFVTTPLKKKEGFAAPGEVRFGWADLYYPKTSSEIRLTSNAEYVVRRVDHGSRTVVEGDDCVTLQQGTTAPGNAVLLRADELTRTLFWLGTPDGVAVDIEEPREGTPHFRTYESANEFLAWLQHQAAAAKNKQSPLTLGGKRLLLEGDPLTPATIDSIDVRPRDLHCG